MTRFVDICRFHSIVVAFAISLLGQLVFGDCAFAKAEESSSKVDRVTLGLILLVDYDSVGDDVIKDRTAIKPPIRFEAETPGAVQRLDDSFSIKQNSIVKSTAFASRIASAVNRTGEVTLEAWIQPEKLDQSGPARIFTQSLNSVDRNFTIGQDGDKFDFRVLSTKTTINGIPSLATKPGAVTTDLTHVVYTRDRTGRTRIYLNGELNVENIEPGDLSNWTEDFHLGIGNELTGERSWLGEFFLLAIYNRDLLRDEVQRNYRAGANAKTVIRLADSSSGEITRFESTIAPIIADHCLECHNESDREGGLDLASQTAAIAGGDSGKVILPGKPYDSSFWTQVVADTMPESRPPLSSKQKQAVKDWIDAGAKWEGGDIDPAVSISYSQQNGIWVRRLTVSEYIATVKHSVDVDIASEARELLPPDLRADGFNNTAYNLGVDLKHVSAYARLAETIVEKMRVEEFIKTYSADDDLSEPNIRKIVGGIGKRLFRGPLEDHEYEPYLRITNTVETSGGSFQEATQLILESMLQAPRFIYQVENHRGDGSNWPVGEYELASRLSYTIWGTPPDELLIKSVESGEFYDQTGIEREVERMLNDPQAIARSVEFVEQWLNLGHLVHLRPDANRFPAWDSALANDMRMETTEYFKEVVWRQNLPLHRLLNYQVTFATPGLARHYQLPSDVQFNEDLKHDLKRFDLSTVPGRGGLLTQGSVLTIGGDDASMVTRGLFVLQDLLRGSVKDPPPGIDSTPVPTEPGLTQRKIAEHRLADASCGGCHSKFEPLAFGLERFDGLGAYYEQDQHGNQLRDDGAVLIPGQRDPIPYATSAELMDVLANSDRIKETLTAKVTQFAIGRPLTASDHRVLKQIHEQATTAGGTYRDLITAIVLSELVQSTPTESPSSGNSK